MRTLMLLVAAIVLAGCGEPGPTGSNAGQPSATAPPAETGLAYTCGGEIRFDPAVLNGPAGAEAQPGPAFDELRRVLADSPDLPPAGWIVIGATPERVEFVAPGQGDELSWVAVGQAGGTWSAEGWGGCRPHAALDGLNLAEWWLDPDAPRPGPDDTTFDAVVTERECASGKPMGARLQPPLIRYQADAVILVFGAVPPPGQAQECPSNPPSRVTVELREPLGERALLDGSVFPPADATEERGF